LNKVIVVRKASKKARGKAKAKARVKGRVKDNAQNVANSKAKADKVRAKANRSLDKAADKVRANRSLDKVVEAVEAADKTKRKRMTRGKMGKANVSASRKLAKVEAIRRRANMVGRWTIIPLGARVTYPRMRPGSWSRIWSIRHLRSHKAMFQAISRKS
jgi:hypothetical protein